MKGAYPGPPLRAAYAQHPHLSRIAPLDPSHHCPIQTGARSTIHPFQNLEKCACLWSDGKRASPRWRACEASRDSSTPDRPRARVQGVSAECKVCRASLRRHAAHERQTKQTSQRRKIGLADHISQDDCSARRRAGPPPVPRAIRLLEYSPGPLPGDRASQRAARSLVPDPGAGRHHRPGAAIHADSLLEVLSPRATRNEIQTPCKNPNSKTCDPIRPITVRGRMTSL